MANVARLEDENAIRQLIAGVVYILDAQEYDRLGEAFAEDMSFNNPGRMSASSLSEFADRLRALPSPAISHFLTNVLVEVLSDVNATSVCKALVVRADGSITASEYRDRLTKTENGWRISERVITPLGGTKQS